MKKHTALKQNIKNDTCVEFRPDIKALTLLADTTFSGNLFLSWKTRKKLTNSGSGIRIIQFHTVTSSTARRPHKNPLTVGES